MSSPPVGLSGDCGLQYAHSGVVIVGCASAFVEGIRLLKEQYDMTTTAEIVKNNKDYTLASW